MNFNNYVNSHPNFPKPGIQFWDFSLLLKSPDACKKAIMSIKAKFQHMNITDIAAVEAKGFTIGSMLAYEMGLPLTLIRKPGLIPGKIKQKAFIKEYGHGEYQLKVESFTPKNNVLIIYDILASAGATKAAIELVEEQGARVLGCAYIIELNYLNGRQELKNYVLQSLVQINIQSN